MRKLGLNVSHYVYDGMWTSNITRARNMTPRMVYEGKVMILESQNLKD